MKSIKSMLGIGLVLLSFEARADVGPDYVCQDFLNVDLPAPVGAIDYWTNVVTSWRNTRSGQVEIFVRGPGLVSKRIEITGDKTDQRWLVPPKEDDSGQGVYLTFDPSECQALSGPGSLYCSRGAQGSASILAAGVNESGKRRQYREVRVQAGSVVAVIGETQVLVSFVLPNDTRISLGAHCDSKDWYAHIPMDELNRTDL